MCKRLVFLLSVQFLSLVIGSTRESTYAVSQIVRNNQIHWRIQTPIIFLNGDRLDLIDLGYLKSETSVCTLKGAKPLGFCDYSRTFVSHRKTVIVQVRANVDNNLLSLLLFCNNNCFHIFVTPDSTTAQILLKFLSVQRLKFKAVVCQKTTSFSPV